MSKVKTAMIDALKQIGSVNDDGSLHLTKENLEQFLARGRRGTKKTKTQKRVVAPSAYRLFMTENLEKIRGEHPEACEGRGNLLKKVGEIWKSMKENNDPIVEKYEKQSKDAKEKMADEKSGSESEASESEAEEVKSEEATAEEAKAEEVKPEEAKAEEAKAEEAKPEEAKPKKKFGPFSERSPPKVEPVSELIAKEMKEKKVKKPKKEKKDKKPKKEKKTKNESGSESESNE